MPTIFKPTKNKSITISDKEVVNLERRLKTLGKKVDTERKGVLIEAGMLLRNTIRSFVPISAEPVKRYEYKGKGAKKSGRGKGKVVATYLPGNLMRSIQILDLERSRAIFVGPKTPRTKRGSTGTFGSERKTDGWYAHIMEYGSKFMPGYAFMRRGVAASQQLVIEIMKRGFKRIIVDYVNRNK